MTNFTYQSRSSSSNPYIVFYTFDLEHATYINHSGIARMVDLIKVSLRLGIEIKFLNVSEQVKSKIEALGMDGIFNCI